MFKSDFHLTWEIADIGLVPARFTGRRFLALLPLSDSYHLKRLVGADTLLPLAQNYFGSRNAARLRRIAAQGVGDEFAGFRDPVRCHDRSKSRATAFAKRHALKPTARNLVRNAPGKRSNVCSERSSDARFVRLEPLK